MARPVGDALVSLLRFLGAEGVLEIIPVRRAARQILKSYPGAEFVHYRDGVLYVWAKDPTVRFRLQTSSRRIARAINGLLGREVVKRVVLRKTPG